MSGNSGIRLGFAVVGAIIGGVLTGGAGFGIALGFTLGNLAGTALFPDQTRAPNIEGPRLNDRTVSTSTYGIGIPIVYGTARVAGNMIWSTDIVEVKKVETVDTGGGKGSPPPKPTQTTYEYYGNFAMSFCSGPIGGFRKVWADGKLLVDLSNGAPPAQPAPDFSGGLSGVIGPQLIGKLFKYNSGNYRIYLGDEEQLPDPLIEADKGVGNVPAYRGLAYIVFDNLPLKDFGNRIPNITAECVGVDYWSPSYQQGEIGVDLAHAHPANLLWLDRTGPFAASFISGVAFKFNRLTGEVIFDVAQGTDADLQAELTAQGRNLQVAAGPQGMWIDSSNGDIYTGAEGTSLQGGGVVRWDPNFKFIQYLHFGLFGGAKLGWSGMLGGVSTSVIASGLVADNISVLRRPADLLGGPLGVATDSFNAGDLRPWNNFAYDPTNSGQSGGRLWIMRRSDDNSTHVLRINADGLVGSDFDLSGLGVPTAQVPVFISYDLASDKLFLVTTSAVYKLDPETMAIVDEIGTTGNPASDGLSVGHAIAQSVAFRYNISTIDGLLHMFPGGSEFLRLNTLTMDVVQRYADTLFSPTADFDSFGSVWDPSLPGLITSEDTYTYYLFDRIGTDNIPISAIVTDLCRRSGLDATDIDVSELTDEVAGFLISNPTNAREAILPLQQAFFFDGAEIDHTLKFVPRNQAVSASIPYADLAARAEGGEDEIKIDEPRRQEVEVPRRVAVSYMDPENDYQVGTQIAQRVQASPGDDFAGITQSRRELQVQVPIVLTDQQAREIAEKTLLSAWIERTTLSFKLAPRWVTLTPTDVVEIEKISSSLTSTIKVRIGATEMGDGGIMQVSAVLQEQAIFTPVVTAAVSTKTRAPAIPFPVGNMPFLLNLPVIAGDLDNEGGAWFASAPAWATGGYPDWRGAALLEGLDPNGPYNDVAVVLGSVAWGVLESQFDAVFETCLFDDVSEVDVRLRDDKTLESRTDLEVYAGANMMYVVDTGEIIQFGEATLTEIGRYTLTHLLRGRFGTEYAIATAGVRATVVFLDAAVMSRFETLDSYQLERFFRAIVLGTQFTTPETIPFTNTSESLRPWSPCSVEGSRDGSNNLTVTWLRRTRLNGEWLDGMDVPLNEDTEAYEVDILDPGDNSIVLRTISVTSPTASYTAAEQTTDGLTPGDDVDLIVYQISAQVGRGHGRPATV